MTLRMDVRDAPSVQQGIEETVRRCGALHLLVNNAGITGPHEVDIDRYAVEDWQEVIATCLSGTFFGMKYGLPAIVAGGGGAVVNSLPPTAWWALPGLRLIPPPSMACWA